MSETQVSFSLEPVAGKRRRCDYVIVAVYDDASAAPRLEKILGRYTKVRQRHYISEDGDSGRKDRIAIYIVESEAGDRKIKSMLKNLEANREMQVVIKRS